MKKLMMVVLAAAGFLFVATCSFAQEAPAAMGNPPMMMGKGHMKGEKAMMGKGCPMQKMMMQKMLTASMVALEDGSIVVMTGNKLYKYDKNLKLVKEVEIKVDYEGMKSMMKEMMGQCPMMKGMKGCEGMGPETEEAPAAE